MTAIRLDECDERDLKGPPYGVVEHVLDEYDQQGCAPTLEAWKAEFESNESTKQQLAKLAEQKPKRRRYTLDELLAQCDPSQPAGDRGFIDAPSVGREFNGLDKAKVDQSAPQKPERSSAGFPVFPDRPGRRITTEMVRKAEEDDIA